MIHRSRIFCNPTPSVGGVRNVRSSRVLQISIRWETRWKWAQAMDLLLKMPAFPPSQILAHGARLSCLVRDDWCCSILSSPHCRFAGLADRVVALSILLAAAVEEFASRTYTMACVGKLTRQDGFQGAFAPVTSVALWRSSGASCTFD